LANLLCWAKKRNDSSCWMDDGTENWLTKEMFISKNYWVCLNCLLWCPVVSLFSSGVLIFLRKFFFAQKRKSNILFSFFFWQISASEKKESSGF
jgi:hypothetical protein